MPLNDADHVGSFNENRESRHQLQETDRLIAGLFLGAAGGTPIRFSSAS